MKPFANVGYYVPYGRNFIGSHCLSIVGFDGTVISDVALKTRIRPERPMAISSVASQMGITASPVAAAVTTFLAMAAKNGQPVGLFDIIRITLPAGIIGVLVAAAWSFNRGKELDQDPEFQERMKDPEFAKALDANVTTLGMEIPFTAKLSVGLFFAGVLTIILIAMKPGLLPLVNGKVVPMTTVVQIIMLFLFSPLLYPNERRGWMPL